jgi:hypothetical protein
LAKVCARSLGLGRAEVRSQRDAVEQVRPTLRPQVARLATPILRKSP